MKLTSLKVHNRGTPPQSFIDRLVAWGKDAPDEIFAKNAEFDIYSLISDELGPFRDITQRKAAMLLVMTVLAGFESSWKWTEGVDRSKSVKNTKDNAETGAWQVSFDSVGTAPGLKELLQAHKVVGAVAFEKAMKTNPELAMEYVARLMRKNVKHNGPLIKGAERRNVKGWRYRANLWRESESIYPYLSKEAMNEFVRLLTLC